MSPPILCAVNICCDIKLTSKDQSASTNCTAGLFNIISISIIIIIKININIVLTERFCEICWIQTTERPIEFSIGLAVGSAMDWVNVNFENYSVLDDQILSLRFILKEEYNYIFIKYKSYRPKMPKANF